MDNLKNEKKVLVLSFIGILTFIAVVVGATYAYFTAQGGGSANTNVNVQTATTDNLSFQVESAISLTANQEDFGSGMPNKSGSTTASATLTANNATNNATRNYYVYLDITSNNFEYTTDDEQAELLLKITDPDGTEVITLGSLERKTSGGVTGFDITTSTGLITIADNYEITSTGTVTQEWQIEVIFANLDSDQNANTRKTFSANLIIQEDLIPTMVADICESGDNLASCISEFNTLVGDGADSIYYHDVDLANGAQDNSYRYSGTNPNNYVCFGATGADCQNSENQYRIIGVFNNQVKLIKSTSYGDYAWDAEETDYPNGNNTWDETTKPDIYTTLNTTYYNTLGSEWQNLIAESTWEVGGMDWIDTNTNTVKQYYDVEVGTGQSGYEETMKIGLMYVSDYGYGSSPEKWTTALYANNYGTDNWLYLDDYEWLLSRSTWLTYMAFYVNSRDGGYVINAYVLNTLAVRPSFSLTSTVELSSGTGTSTDPFVLNLD